MGMYVYFSFHFFGIDSAKFLLAWFPVKAFFTMLWYIFFLLDKTIASTVSRSSVSLL